MSRPNNTLNFSTNWNNKLECKAFTTLRLHNPTKHVVGKVMEIRHKAELKGLARIVQVRTLHLAQINQYIAYLDTGYSAPECRAILQKMYPNADWNTQQIDFMLLVYESKKGGVKG